MLRWIIEPEALKSALKDARKVGHNRLFALAYSLEKPVQWYSRQDEEEMRLLLGSRERSEHILFNCAVAIVVINPMDSDETIDVIIAEQRRRNGHGTGYFDEAF